MHGYGTTSWVNGNKYEGNYVYNRIQGEGTLLFSDGTRYVGYFLNGDFDLRSSSNEYILNSLRYGVNAITLKNGAYDEKLLKNVMHEIIATHIEFSSKDLLQTKESWYAWKNKIGTGLQNN